MEEYMRSRQEWRQARVIDIAHPTEDVRAVTFAVNGPLSAFDPGSHTNIRVMIHDAPAIRTYTVLPSAPGTLKIAVKLHPNSRGGSAWVWSLNPGDVTEMTTPENRFELSWRASHYLLIAGGIGVTPIFGMAPALISGGQSVRMIYGGRSQAQLAFRDELETLLGDDLELFVEEEGRSFDLDAEFSRLPLDAESYVCGPIGLLNASKAAWQRAGRPMSRLRFEVFGDSGHYGESAFWVEIPALRKAVEVRPDQSMLEALLQSGVDMVYDCQRGECGLCAVGVLDPEATIDHRDVFFSPTERAQNVRMCACVSRAPGGTISIDTGYQSAPL
jgi:vanillate O-demethylase ferredoxin subunit